MTDNATAERSIVSTRTIILQVLSGGPSFGAAIIERVSQDTGGAVDLKQGAIYPALEELARQGLVNKALMPTGKPGTKAQVVPLESTVSRGGRPREYYELTNAGRKLANLNREAVADLFCLELPKARQRHKKVNR